MQVQSLSQPCNSLPISNGDLSVKEDREAKADRQTASDTCSSHSLSELEDNIIWGQEGDPKFAAELKAHPLFDLDVEDEDGVFWETPILN